MAVNLQFIGHLAATPPSAPALARGLAKLPNLGNFDWGSPNILPPALRATPLINAGGKKVVHESSGATN